MTVPPDATEMPPTIPVPAREAPVPTVTIPVPRFPLTCRRPVFTAVAPEKDGLFPGIESVPVPALASDPPPVMAPEMDIDVVVVSMVAVDPEAMATALLMVSPCAPAAITALEATEMPPLPKEELFPATTVPAFSVVPPLQLLEELRLSVPDPDWFRDPVPLIVPFTVIALPADSCRVRAAVLEMSPRVRSPAAALRVWLEDVFSPREIVCVAAELLVMPPEIVRLCTAFVPVSVKAPAPLL